MQQKKPQSVKFLENNKPRVVPRLEGEIIMRCVKCGCELTDDMFTGEICFNCGCPIHESILNAEHERQQIAEAAKLAEESKKLEQQRLEKELCEEKKQRLANHALTTGYDFEGYTITKYLGLVSGEVVIGTGYFSDFSATVADVFGVVVPEYTEKLKTAKKNAVDDMKKESVECGGNAIIGISYGYLTFSGNIIGVSVNGTSVYIEKSE